MLTKRQRIVAWAVADAEARRRQEIVDRVTARLWAKTVVANLALRPSIFGAFTTRS